MLLSKKVRDTQRYPRYSAKNNDAIRMIASFRPSYYPWFKKPTFCQYQAPNFPNWEDIFTHTNLKIHYYILIFKQKDQKVPKNRHTQYTIYHIIDHFLTIFWQKMYFFWKYPSISTNILPISSTKFSKLGGHFHKKKIENTLLYHLFQKKWQKSTKKSTYPIYVLPYNRPFFDHFLAKNEFRFFFPQIP